MFAYTDGKIVVLDSGQVCINQLFAISHSEREILFEP